MSDKLNLCFICNEYPPGPHGGIGTFVRVLSRALVAKGHQVRVVGSYEPEYPAADYEEDEGVRVWRNRHATRKLGWLRARYQLYRQVARWSDRGKVDLVELPDWEGWSAAWPKLPAPVIVRLNGSSSYFSRELGHDLRRTVFLLERSALRRADYWCSVSRYTAEQTKSLFDLSDGPSAILYNPVETSAAKSQEPRSKNKVIFTGTLTAKKGIIQLIRAWSEVSRCHPQAELHIYGKDTKTPNGSMREHLESLLASSHSSVHFHGHVSRSQLVDELSRARLAVFPSYAEAFALAPLEAMACGCPTIYLAAWKRTRARLTRGRRVARRSRQHSVHRRGLTTAAIIRRTGRPIGCSGTGQGRERVFDRSPRLSKRRLLQTLHLRLSYGALRPAEARAIGVTNSDEMTQGHDDIVTCLPERTAAQSVLSPEVSPLRPGCTVVVCTYQRASSVARLLDSLPGQTAKIDRLMIVDASPDSETEDLVQARSGEIEDYAELAYFRVSGDFRGLTRQRNFALDRTDTDLVVFFDDDVVLQPHCLAEMMAPLRTRRDLVGVGAYATNEERRPTTIWRIRRALRIVSDLKPGQYCRSGMSIPWCFLRPNDQLNEGDWLPGFGMMWRTRVARQERFNDAFFGYSQGEDLDFSLRMRKRGRLVVAGKARLRHDQDPSAATESSATRIHGGLQPLSDPTPWIGEPWIYRRRLVYLRVDN